MDLDTALQRYTAAAACTAVGTVLNHILPGQSTAVIVQQSISKNPVNLVFTTYYRFGKSI